MGRAYSTDMRDFVDASGEQAELTPETLRLVKFFALVILLALRGNRGRPGTLVIPCKFNPKRRRCKGRIKAGLVSESDKIVWECPACGDSGVISNWRNTPWDFTQWDLDEMSKLLFEEPPKCRTPKAIRYGSTVPVLLTKMDVEMLRKYAFAGKELSAGLVEQNGIRVDLTLNQIEQMLIALTLDSGESCDPRVNAHLDKISLKLDRVLEQYEEYHDPESEKSQ